jgi:hypothetical protein
MEINKQTFIAERKVPISCDRCGITVAWTWADQPTPPILICNLCMHDESHFASLFGIHAHAQNGMPIQSAEHNEELAMRIRASNNVTTNLNNFIISLHDG